MKNLLLPFLALASLWAGATLLPLAFAAASSAPEAQAGAQGAMAEFVTLDRAFVAAMERGEAAGLERAADPDFTWVDPRGVNIAREDLMKALAAGKAPKPALGSANDVRVEPQAYGAQLGVVRRHKDKTHSLHVWARRPAGWRLLSVLEVIELAEVPYGGTTINATCVNPCTTVPFFPANATQQAVMSAWQEQQTGPEGWLRRVAEENVGYSTNGVRTRASRIAVMNQQKASGASVAAPAVVWARIWDFNDAALMLSIQQGGTSKPVWTSRVFQLRNGQWQMVEGFQTTIQDGTVPGPARPPR
jgi:hypothetical protein